MTEILKHAESPRGRKKLDHTGPSRTEREIGQRCPVYADDYIGPCKKPDLARKWHFRQLVRFKTQGLKDFREALFLVEQSPPACITTSYIYEPTVFFIGGVPLERLANPLYDPPRDVVWFGARMCRGDYGICREV